MPFLHGRKGVSLAVAARDGNRLKLDELVAVAVERKRELLGTHAILVVVVDPALGHGNLFDVLLRDRVGDGAAVRDASRRGRIAVGICVGSRVVTVDLALSDPVGVGLASAVLDKR